MNWLNLFGVIAAFLAFFGTLTICSRSRGGDMENSDLGWATFWAICMIGLFFEFLPNVLPYGFLNNY